MNILKTKILLSNHMPTWAFLFLVRTYRLLGRALLNSPILKRSANLLALRVAQRSLTAHDRMSLAASGNLKLRRWNEAFECDEQADGSRTIDLAWVHKPVGGNFGDWLSPYLTHKASGRRLRHVDLSDARRSRHLLSLGSIITRANSQSIVLGSGINSLKDSVNPSARYLMVRGHFTREALPPSARSENLVCCDPGFFVSELYTPKQLPRASARLLIPHINHHNLFQAIGDEDFEILSANVSHPHDLEDLIDRIASADEVITSAMHIFVVCCAYGVRCALIKPENADIRVPGDGVKYRDCMSPVLSEDFFPTEINVRKGIRLRDEIGSKIYEISRDHIRASFNMFSYTLENV